MLHLGDDAARHLPHDCLIRIKANYGAMKKAERNAIDFIVAHPGTIAGMSIVECADKAGCSEATLVRAARRLGYGGFPDLKSAFAGLPEPGDAVVYKSIDADDDRFTVVRKVFQSSIQALQDTLSLMNEETCGKAVDALCRAQRILFAGLGDAGMVAMAAHQKFSRITTACMASEDPDGQLIMAGHLVRGDVLVAISHSGRSRTVLDVVKTGRENDATVLAITNYPASPLAKTADIVLLTADFSEHPNGEVVSRRVSELCIIESLYINYLLASGKKARDAVLRSSRAVSVNKV